MRIEEIIKVRTNHGVLLPGQSVKIDTVGLELEMMRACSWEGGFVLEQPDKFPVTELALVAAVIRMCGDPDEGRADLARAEWQKYRHIMLGNLSGNVTICPAKVMFPIIGEIPGIEPGNNRDCSRTFQKLSVASWVTVTMPFHEVFDELRDGAIFWRVAILQGCLPDHPGAFASWDPLLKKTVIVRETKFPITFAPGSTWENAHDANAISQMSCAAIRECDNNPALGLDGYIRVGIIREDGEQPEQRSWADVEDRMKWTPAIHEVDESFNGTPAEELWHHCESQETIERISSAFRKGRF